ARCAPPAGAQCRYLGGAGAGAVMTSYPEHDKLKALGGINQTVGDFIEWLGENGMTICEFVGDREFGRGGGYVPTHNSRDRLLAAFFEIDADELSQEKDRMLEDFRKIKVHVEEP